MPVHEKHKSYMATCHLKLPGGIVKGMKQNKPANFT